MAHRDDSEWLTLGQAARFLGVAQSTIRKWSDNGRVPAFYTPGGHRRYRRTDLETFLDRSGPGGRPKAGPLVLLVDDDEKVRELVRVNLEFEGYTVRGRKRTAGARGDRGGEARPRPPRRDDAAGRRLGDAPPDPGSVRRGRDTGDHVQRPGGRGSPDAGGLGRRPRLRRQAVRPAAADRPDEADRTRLTGWDRHAERWIVHHRWHPLNDLFVFLTKIGSHGLLWLILRLLLAAGLPPPGA